MKLKVCTNCKRRRRLSSFNKNKNRVGGLQSFCRDCCHKKFKNYYHKNRRKQIDVVRIRTRRILADNRARLLEYLESHHCVDCGESDPVVLDLDHLRDKKCAVSVLVRGSYRWVTIAAELEKCEVRCANCHRRKTAIAQNSYKVRHAKLGSETLTVDVPDS